MGNIVDTRTYDIYGALSGYSATVGGIGVYSYTITRDVMQRVTGMSETVQGTTTAYLYTYDTASRLKTAKANGVLVASFNYDTNGNRTSMFMGGVTTTPVYDNQDRLTSMGVDVYAHNKNGDRASWSNGTGTTTYAYDSFSNIKQVTLPSAAVTTYFYDASQRLLGSTNLTSNRGYLYEDALRVAANLNSEGTIRQIYYYPTGSKTPDYLKDSAGVYYRVISNYQGSPILIINIHTGSVVQKLSYNVLGKIASDTNAGFQPFAFAGGMYDSNTKFVRFGARDYDPVTGRWTTKDPIGFGGGDTNLYGYVLNDPVNFADPSGLFKVKVGDLNFDFNKNSALAAGGALVCGTLATGNPIAGFALGLVAGGLTALHQGTNNEMQSLIDPQPTPEIKLP